MEPTASLAPSADENLTTAHVRPLSESQFASATTLTERYRLIEKINEGGMGVVYRAYDKKLEREIAIKMVKPGKEGDDAYRRFLEETLISAQLQHPSIPPIHDIGTLSDGRPFLAMKLIKGQTLEKLLASGEKMEKLEVFANICQALAYAHSKNVVHRDLKSANVMVGAFGETQVMDWGLAKVLTEASKASPPSDRGDEEGQSVAVHNPRSGSGSEESTQAGLAVGTYAYMPPEQAAGAKMLIGKPSDVFGLGAILCEMITGKPPYVKRADDEPTSYLAATGKLGDALARIEACEATAELKAICRKCLDADPKRRFAHAGDLATAVADLQKLVLERSRQAEVTAARSRDRKRYAAVAACITAIGIAFIGFGYVRTQSRALAERLLDGPTAEVPKLLPGVRMHWAGALLKEAAEGDEPKRKLNASLALIANDPSRKDYIAERLPDAAPADVSVLVEALRPHADAVKPSPNNLPVAAFQGTATPEVAAMLVAENPLHFASWLKAFRPVAGKLQPEFASIYRDENRLQSERAQAVNFLAEYAKEDPAVLADLVMDSDETAFRTLYPVLAKHGPMAIDALRVELARKLDDKAPEPDRLRLASRQATAAVTLIRLGKPGDAWPRLQFSPDPTVRSWIIHRLKPYGVDTALVRSRFQSEADVSAKRSLVLILGEYGQGDAAMIDALKAIYAMHPDAGLHAAAEWTLRQWKEEKWNAERMKEWAADKEGREKRIGSKETRWYVTGQGQPMVVVPGPTEFLMGSPETDSLRYEFEIQHKVRIPRTFAIMARHVTVEEFQRFNASFKPGSPYFAKVSPTPDCPVHGVTWYEAAGYCNWLSKQEGIHPDQWCYEEAKDGKVIKLKPKYLSLTGYRLPSEMEAECAARAGTGSRWSFGEDVALLDRYGWMQRNSGERSWPFGAKKPNDLGSFDGHGNMYTQCGERHQGYNASKEVREDAEDSVLDISNSASRVLRGGSWIDRPTTVRSASRSNGLPTQRFAGYGLRPARTLPFSGLTVLPSVLPLPEGDDF